MKSNLKLQRHLCC